MSLLVVMGSGETAPTMVKVHREVLGLGPPGPAVMLDTPFGFQLNADDLVARTKAYFAESVGTPVQVARWRRADAPAVEHEQSLSLLGQAAWVFAGPGSPTYALRQWRGTALPEALLDVADRGGTLVFGSAAACTLGTHAVPVYEIYKAGEEPRWATGLDLLGRLTGIEAVVVPHYDNAEGGQYDTRYCYLGEPRLAGLEAELPPQVGVLGVDEHTALIIDTEARIARVTGNGVVTLRHRAQSQSFGHGAVLDLDTMAAALHGQLPAERPGPAGANRTRSAAAGSPPTDGPPSARPPSTGPLAGGTATGGRATDGTATGGTAGRPADEPPPPPASLAAEAATARDRFEAALAAGDPDGCVGAILDLETAIVAWSADTMQNDETDRARRVLRSLVVRLGELARVGARDGREVIGPFVEALLELRARARASKDYPTSDLVRERLTGSGIEVRDTADGSQWMIVD